MTDLLTPNKARRIIAKLSQFTPTTADKEHNHVQVILQIISGDKKCYDDFTGFTTEDWFLLMCCHAVMCRYAT